jgi:hypothetical protein
MEYSVRTQQLQSNCVPLGKGNMPDPYVPCFFVLLTPMHALVEMMFVLQVLPASECSTDPRPGTLHRDRTFLLAYNS